MLFQNLQLQEDGSAAEPPIPPPPSCRHQHHPFTALLAPSSEASPGTGIASPTSPGPGGHSGTAALHLADPLSEPRGSLSVTPSAPHRNRTLRALNPQRPRNDPRARSLLDYLSAWHPSLRLGEGNAFEEATPPPTIKGTMHDDPRVRALLGSHQPGGEARLLSTRQEGGGDSLVLGKKLTSKERGTLGRW